MRNVIFLIHLSLDGFTAGSNAELAGSALTESFLEYSCKTLAEANLALLAQDPLSGPDRQYTLLDVVPLLR